MLVTARWDIYIFWKLLAGFFGAWLISLEGFAQVPAYLESMRWRNPSSFEIFKMNYTKPTLESGYQGSSGVKPVPGGMSLPQSDAARIRQIRRDVKVQRKEDEQRRLRAEGGDLNEVLYFIEESRASGDVTEEKYWLEKAGNLGDVQSLYSLYNLTREIKWLEMADVRGFQTATVLLAGHYNDADPQRSLQYLQRISPGNAIINRWIAELYLRKNAPYGDEAKGWHLLRKSAAEGDSTAKFLLAKYDNPKTKEAAELALRYKLQNVFAEDDCMIVSDWSGKLFLTDLKGHFYVKQGFSLLRQFSKGIYCYYDNNVYRLVDNKGRPLGTGEYGFIGELKNDRALFLQNGWYGYLDGKGNMAIQPVYRYAQPFDAKTAKVINDGYFTEIDANGKAVSAGVEPMKLVIRYGRLYDNNSGKNVYDDFKYSKTLSNGWILVSEERNYIKYYGVLDQQGKWIYPPIDRENVLPGEWIICGGVIREDGTILVTPGWDKLERNYSLENSWYITGRGKKGLVQAGNDYLLKPEYDSIVDYSYKSGKWKVKKGGKWGLVTRGDIFILECEYDDFEVFGVGDSLWRVKQNGLWGVLRSPDRMIIPCLYDKISGAGGNMRKLPALKTARWNCLKSGKTIYLDEKGTPLQDTSISIEGFNDVLVLKIGSSLCLADTAFNILFRDIPATTSTGEVVAGGLVVIKDGKQGLYDYKAGKMVLDPVFKNISSIGHPFIAQVDSVSLDVRSGKAVAHPPGLIPKYFEDCDCWRTFDSVSHKAGVVDNMFKPLLPFEYLEVRPLSRKAFLALRDVPETTNGYWAVFINYTYEGKWGIVDEKGNPIVPYRLINGFKVHNGYVEFFGKKPEYFDFSGRPYKKIN